VLSEYCLPFCRVGGKFVAMKGPAAADEISAAQVAVKILGGEIESVREVMLPEGAGVRSLISIRKVTRTPKAYPRKAGTPAKNPLAEKGSEGPTERF
jgi:16S rRNA (guanine527-N7)-methyltransferase